MLVTKQNFDMYEWSKVQKFEEKDIGHDWSQEHAGGISNDYKNWLFSLWL